MFIFIIYHPLKISFNTHPLSDAALSRGYKLHLVIHIAFSTRDLGFDHALVVGGYQKHKIWLKEDAIIINLFWRYKNES